MPDPDPTTSEAARLWELACGATHRAGVWLAIVAYCMALVDVGPHPLFCAIAFAWVALVVLPASWLAARGQTKTAVEYILTRPTAFSESLRVRWYKLASTRECKLGNAVDGRLGTAMLLALGPSLSMQIWLPSPEQGPQVSDLGLMCFGLLGLGGVFLVATHVWRTEGRQQLKATANLDAEAILIGEGYTWRWWWGWSRPCEVEA